MARANAHPRANPVRAPPEHVLSDFKACGVRRLPAPLHAPAKRWQPASTGAKTPATSCRGFRTPRLTAHDCVHSGQGFVRHREPQGITPPAPSHPVALEEAPAGPGRAQSDTAGRALPQIRETGDRDSPTTMSRRMRMCSLAAASA